MSEALKVAPLDVEAINAAQQAVVDLIAPQAPRYPEPRVPADVLRRAVHDWLNQRRIWNAILRAGIAKRDALLLCYQNIPEMAPEAIEALAASLMRDRTVRLQVARYMQRRGHAKKDVMRDLGKLAELWREVAHA